MPRPFVVGLFILVLFAQPGIARPLVSPRPPAEVIAAARELATRHRARSPGPKTVARWLRQGFLHTSALGDRKHLVWVIDSEKGDDSAGWCGTGGCTYQFWLRRDDGHYHKVLDTQFFDLVYLPLGVGSRHWLSVQYHGSVCGLTGGEECPWGYELDEKGQLVSSLRFLKGDTLRSLPVPQALDPLTQESAALIPIPLRRLIQKQVVACAGWKGTISLNGLVNHEPDLNGDGVDDWSYDALDLSCNRPSHKPQAVDNSGIRRKSLYEEQAACSILDCLSQVWLSQRDRTGRIGWKRAKWDETKLHAIMFRLNKPPMLYELSALPNAAGVPGDCDTYNLAACARKPISITPNR